MFAAPPPPPNPPPPSPDPRKSTPPPTVGPPPGQAWDTALWAVTGGAMGGALWLLFGGAYHTLPPDGRKKWRGDGGHRGGFGPPPPRDVPFMDLPGRYDRGQWPFEDVKKNKSDQPPPPKDTVTLGVRG